MFNLPDITGLERSIKENTATQQRLYELIAKLNNNVAHLCNMLENQLNQKPQQEGTNSSGFK
jgi:hypothetical protein